MRAAVLRIRSVLRQVQGVSPTAAFSLTRLGRGHNKIQTARNHGSLRVPYVEGITFCGYTYMAMSLSAARLSACTSVPDTEHPRLPGAVDVQARVVPVPPDSLTGWQEPPARLLCKLWSHLPLSSHNACALVCRSWHASQPDLRVQLASWLHQQARARQNSGRLTPAYEHRIRPWLESHRSPFLPALQCQYQVLRECERLQAESGDHRQQAQRAQRLFSGLLQYSLRQQLIQTDQIALQAMPFNQESPGFVGSVSLSPCGRWFATSQHLTTMDDGVLHVYGWEPQGWQPAILSPPATASVEKHLFGLHQPDTLISAHSDGALFEWCRDPDTHVWQRQLICQRPAPHSGRAFGLLSFADCGIIALYKSQMNCHLLMVPFETEGRRWGVPVMKDYPLSPSQTCFLAWTTATNELAAVSEIDTHGNESFFYSARAQTTCCGQRKALHIWKTGVDAAHPQAWGCHVFEWITNSPTTAMMYSPDGSYLLTLSPTQTALWKWGSEHRPQLQLSASRYFGKNDGPFSRAAQFSQDGRQLAVLASSDSVQLWSMNNEECWHCQTTLTMPGGDITRAGDCVRYISLSSDGKTLAWVTNASVSLWHQEAGDWKKRVQRSQDATCRGWPTACLLPMGDGELFVTAAGQEGTLWIHGPDQQGQFVRKASFSLGRPVQALHVSEDGLSVLAFCASGPQLTLLQLRLPDRQHASQAGSDRGRSSGALQQDAQLTS